MPWAKGQSGNPNGRPALPESTRKVREAAREHTEAAIKTLVDVMTDTSAPQSARVAAANALLDRGYGKAPQHIEADVTTRTSLADILTAMALHRPNDEPMEGEREGVRH